MCSCPPPPVRARRSPHFWSVWVGSSLPVWRELLGTFRRMEARGEIRGDRFVAGFVGEHFARPEAVDLLRGVRRDGPATGSLSVPAADPLNLTGIVLPGPHVSALSGGLVELLPAADPTAVVAGAPGTTAHTA